MCVTGKRVKVSNRKRIARVCGSLWGVLFYADMVFNDGSFEADGLNVESLEPAVSDLDRHVEIVW